MSRAIVKKRKRMLCASDTNIFFMYILAHFILRTDSFFLPFVIWCVYVSTTYCLLSRFFFVAKKREKKKQRITIGVYGCYFFFFVCLSSPQYARVSNKMHMQLQPRRERERGRRKQLEGHVLYARKHGYSRKISLELKKRCNKSLTLSSAIVYL
jgi:hypothetical protein